MPEGKLCDDLFTNTGISLVIHNRNFPSEKKIGRVEIVKEGFPDQVFA